MNTYYKSLVTLVLIFIGTIGFGQPRLSKGTVYSKEGNKVAGVMSNRLKIEREYCTSFEGYYEINANIKSKWINFNFPDRVEKLNLTGITRDVIDFGEYPDWKKSDLIQRNEIKREEEINKFKHK
jgi:hypothetical protein